MEGRVGGGAHGERARTPRGPRRAGARRGARRRGRRRSRGTPGASPAARRSCATASPARASAARAWPTTWCASGEPRWRAARRSAAAPSSSPMDRERRAASASSRKAAVASSQSALVGADAEAAPLFRGILRLFLRRPMAVAVFPGDAPVKSAKAAEITNGSEEREATKLTSNDSSRGRGPTCHCKIFFEPILCKSFLLKLKTDLCASS